MTTSNIAFVDHEATFRVSEDRGVYDGDTTAADNARHLHKAQGKIGEALNLAGLILKSLEDEGDGRAMQIYTAVHIIEKTLQKALRRLDRHEARHAKL